jgi:hypothetical protein
VLIGLWRDCLAKYSTITLFGTSPPFIIGAAYIVDILFGLIFPE